MDFEELLHVARKNELHKKEPVKCLQTKFKPPTKEQHEKDKALSEGIQKFLARKEQEEKQKQKEAERRRLELMALRAKDPKANKRIQTMLKRTKSANKSVMEDAVDNNNTADTLAGPSQPDEDDYGFVSESSSQLYNKLIQKMYSTPSDNTPKFAPMKKPTGSNLLNTKERVKMALLKQEEEEKLPHKRKRKGKDKRDEEEEAGIEYGVPDRDLSKVTSEPYKEKTEKPKPKRPPPPPVDFQELLKIAEQKQFEPIVFEPKVKKTPEPEVLMTKKQKQEYEKMQQWKRQRELRLKNLENGEKSSQEDKKSIPKIPKVSQSDSKSTESSQKKSDDRLGNHSKSKIISKPKEVNGKIAKVPEKKPPVEKKIKEEDDETSRLIKERDEALRKLKEKERLIKERDEAMRKLKEKEQLIRERDEAMRKLKMLEESEKSKSSASSTPKPPQKVVSSKRMPKVEDVKSAKDESGVKKRPLPPPKPEAAKGAVMNGSGPKEFPPRDLKQLPKIGASKNIQRSKQFPPADVRRKPLLLKRGRIESDDEYDSELDDFIDDDGNEVGTEEVSKVISEIFGYDKNKYSKYDDVDDECMESNFAQISKEEFFSTKCGILEDLKDIQREKAKLAKKKKR